MNDIEQNSRKDISAKPKSSSSKVKAGSQSKKHINDDNLINVQE